MAIELKIPSVGESVSEVQVGEWQFAVGDFVEEDETVVVIETDKVNVDLPAPASGTLKEIVKEEGDDAEVGDVVGYLEEGEAEESEPSEEEKKEAPEEKEEEKAEEKEKEEKGEEEEKAGKEADEKEADKKKDEGEVRVMPAARRLLEEHGLSVSDVEATGPGGRLLKEDVLRHLESEDAAAEAPDSAEGEVEPSRADAGRAEERQRMTPLRRKVASRLVQAQEEAALLTTFNEIDMSAVMELRKKYKAEFQERYDIKLGFMSFFVKATVEALKEIPQVNAEIDGEEIVFKNYQDIGVAVGGGKGLVVPILRNAERMSFAEVEEKIADLASRAQEGKLELSELEGGTFTISNGGVYGSLLSTPIVNPPQSGILGLHKIEERPVAVDGEVMIRPMMYVALTYDHRIVDGREAVTFLVKIKERIEDPSRILLEV